MSIRGKIIIVLLFICLGLGFFSYFIYNKYINLKKTLADISIVEKQLKEVKQIVANLQGTIGGIKTDTIKAIAKIKPSIIINTYTYIETSSYGGIEYCTKTIVVKETLKNTEIYLVMTTDGRILSSETDTVVIINDTEIGFCLRPTLSLFYYSDMKLPVGIDVLFFKFQKVYVGCNFGLGFDVIGLDVNYNLYRNTNVMIGYGSKGLYGGITVFF